MSTILFEVAASSAKQNATNNGATAPKAPAVKRVNMAEIYGVVAMFAECNGKASKQVKEAAKRRLAEVKETDNIFAPRCYRAGVSIRNAENKTVTLSVAGKNGEKDYTARAIFVATLEALAK